MSDGLEEFSQLAGSSNSKPSSRARTIDHEFNENANQNLRSYVKNGFSYFPIGTTVKKLPPAVYTVGHDDSKGPYFTERDMMLDELMVLPDTNCERVLEDIKFFWTREKNFRDHGFLWKRGILLWGPPGGGKTSLIQMLSKEIVALGGLTIFGEYPRHVVKALEALRKVEKDRPIVVILEDVDAIVKTYGESDLLALLDGEAQIDNVVYVATTNYPESLDRRLVNRPSRFDEVIKIGMPSADARRIYLQKKIPRFSSDPNHDVFYTKNQAELVKWIEGTKDFSIAHLRELIVSVECLGRDIEDALSRLKIMNKVKSSSESDSKGSLGFTAEI